MHQPHTPALPRTTAELHARLSEHLRYEGGFGRNTHWSVDWRIAARRAADDVRAARHVTACDTQRAALAPINL